MFTFAHMSKHSVVNLTFLVLLAGMLYFGSACTKIEFIEDSSATLEFSIDTLSFDTVFTTVGSATRSFRVYNRNDKFVRVSKISVAQEREFFRMNVDGLVGNEITDVEIPPNDSIWIFLEVTVDPDEPFSMSPFVINERINFETNGNQQSIVLEAWGQNANYIPSRFSAGEQRLITCDLNEWVWDDPRPYVIFGVLVVDSCTLTMPPGTQVYVHGGFGTLPDGTSYNDGILFFLQNGKLNIAGTAENPVVIQGDRLEDAFAETSGQWGRIHLDDLSRGNEIEHAIIKNSILGIYVDSLADLSIRNSQIQNTSSSGMIGYRASIDAENCLFHTSGGNNVTISLGGSYNFKYCTLANYGVPTEALRASNFTCLDDPLLCNQPVAARLSLNFVNSIITGSSMDEISLIDAVPDDPDFFSYRFDHCIVRVDELLEPNAWPDFFENCTNCIENEREDLLFVDANGGDFHLDSLSIAEQMATPLQSIRQDLEGRDRDLTNPDIGCYEYVN